MTMREKLEALAATERHNREALEAWKRQAT